MLPHNMALADHLEGIAYYLELYKTDENWEYRAPAYRAAARMFRKLGYEILTDNEAKVYKGVGEKISKRVLQFALTGTSTKLEKLRGRDIERDIVVSDLLQVKEISIVRANDLYEQGVTSLEDLRSKPDLLQKSELIYLAKIDRFSEVIPREEIFSFENAARRAVPNNIRVIAVGNYRRGLPSTEIDLLITHSGKTIVHMRDVLLSLTRLIRESLSDKDALMSFRGVTHSLRIVNMRLFQEVRYPTALLHMTGSDAFRVDMRRRAEMEGLHLNEYRLARGVARPVSKPRVGARGKKGEAKLNEVDIEENRMDEEQLPISIERDIFDTLDLPYVIPRDRT